MRQLTEIEKKAQVAVSKLRKETLQKGEPFMIYNKTLPKGKYYMEYPDGEMKVVTVSRQLNDFVVEEDVKPRQADLIRNRINSKYR
ncbi:hypothetical protein SAMN05518672_102709 [Chitinophaga sp. CF118]|uniref:hypothetical protein n=1 Tax=Chitinophaga sp. CF118 TaxID=1884367 RepID=UPI0008E698B7|nr:hypothetical protein [Chitinophaga sp. CF118]SFD63343.1 hypothetical protein SAMN05518672_102709 [Chitinophaga sp. CF118]